MADALRIDSKAAESLLGRGVDYRFVVKGAQPSLLARLDADDWQALENTPQTGLNRKRIKTRGSEFAEDLAGHLEFLGAHGAPNAFERGRG